MVSAAPLQHRQILAFPRSRGSGIICCSGLTCRLGQLHAGPEQAGRAERGSYLQQQLHDVPVHQAQHRLPVDVRDEVSSSQPRFLRRAPFFHALQQESQAFARTKPTPPTTCGIPTVSLVPGATYPDHVVHGVDVAVPHVDPDGSQREAVFLA